MQLAGQVEQVNERDAEETGGADGTCGVMRWVDGSDESSCRHSRGLPAGSVTSL
jgi:hypothetical protein